MPTAFICKTIRWRLPFLTRSLGINPASSVFILGAYLPLPLPPLLSFRLTPLADLNAVHPIYLLTLLLSSPHQDEV